MKELVVAFLLKIRKGNAIAWAVLVSLVTILGSAFSNTLGFPLPTNIQAFIDTVRPYALPLLVFLQACIVAAKDSALLKISTPSSESTRGFMANDSPTPQSIAAEALKY